MFHVQHVPRHLSPLRILQPLLLLRFLCNRPSPPKRKANLCSTLLTFSPPQLGKISHPRFHSRYSLCTQPLQPILLSCDKCISHAKILLVSHLWWFVSVVDSKDTQLSGNTCPPLRPRRTPFRHLESRYMFCRYPSAFHRHIELSRVSRHELQFAGVPLADLSKPQRPINAPLWSDCNALMPH